MYLQNAGKLERSTVEPAGRMLKAATHKARLDMAREGDQEGPGRAKYIACAEQTGLGAQ